MPTVNFLMKSKKSHASIHVRFRDGTSIDLCKRIKLCTNPSYWDKTNGCVKNTTLEPNSMFINSKLKGLEAIIFKRYMEDITEGEHIDSLWLEDVIDIYFNQKNMNEDYKVYFSEFGKKWLEECQGKRINVSNGKLVTKGSLTEYRQALDTIIHFDKYYKTKTKFLKMDFNWHAKWLDFMTNTMQYSYNSKNNKLAIIKMVIREAKTDFNIKINPKVESKKFTVPHIDEDIPDDIYLDDHKIKVIFHMDVEKRLQRSKDLLIIACWTGLRISDFMHNLNLDNMEKGIIDVKNKKTKKWVKVPLHPMINVIIKKNDGKLPKSICEGKLNLDVKEIATLAGFTAITDGGVTKVSGKSPITGKNMKRKVYGKYLFHELVCSHIGRRSFSSNLTGKISDEVIMNVAGWSDQQMKEHYNKKEKTQSAMEADEYFKSEYGYIEDSCQN